jgi:RHS repeat-associated protein
MMTEQVDGSATHDYLYTVDGERIATRDVPGGRWTWEVRSLEGKVLREFASWDGAGSLGSANWRWTRDYVYRDGELLMAVVQPSDPAGNPAGDAVTEHFHLDHLGSPRVLTDGAGVKLGFHTYYAFGAEQMPGMSESPADAMKFTGHERDTLAGDVHTLDYMRARYYSAMAGRFFSVDPVSGDSASPQSWNSYAYAGNDPTRYVDPDGREPSLSFSANCPGVGCSDPLPVLPSGGVSRQHYFWDSPWGSLFHSELTNLSYVRPGDLFSGRATLHGLEAFADGVIPDVSFCDSCDKYSDPSRAMDSMTSRNRVCAQRR